MKKSKLIAPALALSTLGGTAGLAYAFLDKGEEKIVKVNPNVNPNKEIGLDLNPDSVGDFVLRQKIKRNERALMSLAGTTNITAETVCTSPLCRGQKVWSVKIDLDIKEGEDIAFQDIEAKIQDNIEKGYYPLDWKTGLPKWDVHWKGLDEMETN